MRLIFSARGCLRHSLKRLRGRLAPAANRIIGSLLAGSLPGIILGSYLTVRVPEPALRVLLAATLILVAGKLAYDHIESSSSLLTAFTRSAPH